MSLSALVFEVVVVSLIAFVIVFATHRKPPAGPEQKRETKSIVGIVLQGSSYAVVWIIHRQYFSPLVFGSKPLEIALAIITIILAIASVWFISRALKTLGKQWSLAARVVKDHKLITEGPYRVVRNPIYTGMLGMLLATGLAVGQWIGLIVAVVVFALGTLIRVRSEERLLREMFGVRWEEYARTVPAVVPFIV